MAIETMTYLIVKCDVCDETLKDAEGDVIQFETHRGARSIARAEGWDLGDGSYALCDPTEKKHAAQLRIWLGE
jgi:hypothetical protein